MVFQHVVRSANEGGDMLAKDGAVTNVFDSIPSIQCFVSDCFINSLLFQRSGTNNAFMPMTLFPSSLIMFCKTFVFYLFNEIYLLLITKKKKKKSSCPRDSLHKLFLIYNKTTCIQISHPNSDYKSTRK